MYSLSRNYIQFVVCQNTGLQPFLKWVFHIMRSSAFLFNLQHIHFPLRPSSRCLHLLHYLSVTLSPSLPLFLFQWSVSKSSSVKVVINSVTLSFLLFVGYSSFFTLCNTSFLTQSVQLIFSIFFCTTFQSFSPIFDLLSEVSKSQYHTKLCSKCSILLISFLYLIPICWLKEPSPCWMLHVPWLSWI